MGHFILLSIFCVSSLSPINGENIYDQYFKKEPPKGEYHDTLFERTIWHKKVSHLVIETKENTFWVTMLVHPETPNNFKAQTYALYYEFKNYQQAYDKFIWLDKFLKAKKILKVKISGNRIVSERIMN